MKSRLSALDVAILVAELKEKVEGKRIYKLGFQIFLIWEGKYIY